MDDFKEDLSQWVKEKIIHIHKESKKRYGAPKIHEKLKNKDTRLVSSGFNA